MSQKIEFQVAGDKVTGHWHFPSDGTAPWPLVLMGHGFATLWHFGTGPSIEAFNNAGFAVFTFDYRHFGDSDGQPRQLISVPKQLDDWRAALQQVRGDSRIDAVRIALWGSSFGGGHALSIAAENTDVAAVISQVPHCDSRGLFKTLPVAATLKTASHVLLDQLYRLVGKVHTLPVVADPGVTAALAYPGWKQGYLSLVSPNSNWRNEIPARSLLGVTRYNPIDVADRIRCPVLIIYGTRDEGIPVAKVQATAARIEHCSLQPLDCDHFDVYHGECLAWCLSLQLDFLKQQLQK
jgi:pimeloyl-ACP methyl ester carboxylesterase